jgi:hypothetical protein
MNKTQWVDFRGSITLDEYKMLEGILLGEIDPDEMREEVESMLDFLDPVIYEEGETYD